MLILRSHGHLLFSIWTISQRTVSEEAEASSDHVQTFKHPRILRERFRVWDGKSRFFQLTCKGLLKFLFTEPIEPTTTTSFEGALKNVFPKAAANVGRLSTDATLEQEKFHLRGSRGGRSHWQNLAVEEFMSAQGELRHERTHLIGRCWGLKVWKSRTKHVRIH